MTQELLQLVPGQFFAGRYRVERLIRAGGMGAVYEVEDASTLRKRALKVMHPALLQSPDARMRFDREVKSGALVKTEHIVEVTDAGLDQQTQTPFMVMELLHGEELGDRCERLKRLSLDETIAILMQISRALDKAHAQGIVHRDLKPENVFLVAREDGTSCAKILDFGIAKLNEGARTNATQASGTPLYMAPEQTDKVSHVTPQTDIWAFGLMAFRMIVGEPYWLSESLNQLYREVLIDEMVPATMRAYQFGVSLPPAFDAWFARCVNRKPELRFRTAGEATTELAQILGVMQRPTYAGQPGPYYATPTYSTPDMGAAQVPVPALQAYTHVQPQTPTPHYTPSGTQPNYGQAPSALQGTQLAPLHGTPPHHTVPSNNTTPQAIVRAIEPQPPQIQPRSNTGAIVAVLVGVLGLSVGAYFAFVKPSTSTKGTTSLSNTEPTGETTGKLTGTKNSSKETSPTTSASAPVEADVRIKPKSIFPDAAVALNPFLNVPSVSVTLQKHEVSREEYAMYLEHRKANSRPVRMPLAQSEGLAVGGRDGKLPITWITYEMAEDYCLALGARLPSTEEFDAAVSGNDQRKFPWGNQWPKADSTESRDVAVGRLKGTGPMEVGISPLDKGPFDHLDLAGNVQEWTSSDHKMKFKKIRGAHIESKDESEMTRLTYLFTEASASPNAVAAAKAGALVGFRCAKGK